MARAMRRDSMALVTEKRGSSLVWMQWMSSASMSRGWPGPQS